MSSQIKLPLTRRFPMPFSGIVYPSPQASRGVTVRGQGHFTLTFEPTKDANIAQVRFEDFFAKLDPCRIPFDIDGDGMLECLELDRLQFGKEAVDLDKSGGEYNLENKHIRLELVFTIGQETLGGLGTKPGLRSILPVPFELVEQGWLDLETGHYITHSSIYTIPSGPFAGLTLMGDWPPPQAYLVDPCPSLLLGVSIAEFTSRCSYIVPPPSMASKQIWICPSTPIVLTWEAENVEYVEISPSLGRRLSHGHQLIPELNPEECEGEVLLSPELGLAIERSTTYMADTVAGECGPEREQHDQVEVIVVNEEKESSQTAEFRRAGYSGIWFAELYPNTYDENLKVNGVIIDSGQPHSVTHPSWRLDHIFPGEDPAHVDIESLNTWASAEFLFSLPGEYRFTPMPVGTSLPSGEEELTLYFRLKIACQE
ncbi:MAG: hypothetical protein BroJett011_76510 [Chloroflexota bacterium]|nr:MAG: hypothetical protein BroJett011_76510 [Chloroflexota bacterium]